MKVILLEDEIPAFNKLSKYLLDHNSEVKILGWFRSLENAFEEKELFAQCDLILSDIKLLDGSSFELFHQLEVNCPIIFCTAYNKYMEDAFETNGIAYLVKPYSQESFNKAMYKYDQLFKKSNLTQLNMDAFGMIEQMLHKSIKNYKQRFSIKKENGIIVKPVADIIFFKALGDFCSLVDIHKEKHNISYKISNLEQLLDPQHFFRINRSEIVNIAFIKKVEPYFKNKMQIILSDKTVLTTSGSRTPEFRLWLDGK
ncbi:LytTR family two component transcriptional regulator [Aquimarina sp. MAR_2010_214]|uniref:LytR/AlgR family response regulator transcription factor n=1 Tax=Aquimarina sp. MAR_2010_214 TaxID=1250026 RepID=UPI000C711D84|nr:LytTR family DNA-binding domain-containing protein [Aquimarina sp. MAR_2010_214]PKV51930.1 LytTR family two component transcriptional regulator [Aquimarina sp. MAR_2010_214]